MSSCLVVRAGLAAVVGYSLGALAGGATVAWMLAAVAVAGTYLWSRRRARRGAACGAACAPSQTRKASASVSEREPEAGPQGAHRRSLQPTGEGSSRSDTLTQRTTR